MTSATPQPLDPVTASVLRHRDVLLAQLKARAEHTHEPDRAQVLAATPEALTITPNSNQGTSKRSFLVELGDRQAMLSVFVPNPGRGVRRLPFDDRLEYRRELRQAGLPIPGKIGRPFQLPGLPYPCELTEFVPGYTVPRKAPFTLEQVRAVGNALGAIHACEFKPKSSPTLLDRTAAFRGLPHGFVHGDLSPGNLIFDKQSHALNGVIDFEWAGDKCLLDDLVRTMRFYIPDKTQEADGLKIAADAEKTKAFLDAYEHWRPLTPKEQELLPKFLEQALQREQGYWDKLAKTGNGRSPVSQFLNLHLRPKVGFPEENRSAGR